MFMRGVWLEQCTLLAAMRFIGALGHEGFARAAGTCSGLWPWRTARGQRCAQVSIVHGLRRLVQHEDPSYAQSSMSSAGPWFALSVGCVVG